MGGGRGPPVNAGAELSRRSASEEVEDCLGLGRRAGWCGALALATGVAQGFPGHDACGVPGVLGGVCVVDVALAEGGWGGAGRGVGPDDAEHGAVAPPVEALGDLLEVDVFESTQLELEDPSAPSAQGIFFLYE